MPVWFDWILLGVAVVIFALLTIPSLSSQGAYFDEGYSAYLAQLSPLQAAYYTSLDVHPPLYYILLHVWQSLFGNDIVTLRLLSVVLGAGCITVAFLLTRRLFGRRASCFILPAIIFLPLFIRYSEAARMYTLALLCCLAATYCLVRLLQPSRHRRVLWVLYGVFVAAGMWTNYFTALVWLSHLGWLLHERIYTSTFRTLRGWIAAIGFAVALYLPWLPQLLGRYQDIQQNGFWIKPISVDTFVSTITVALTLKHASDVTGWMAVLILVSVVIVIALVITTYRQFVSEKQPFFRLYAWLALGPIVLLTLISLPPFRPAYTFRYALVGLFFATLLIAISVATIQWKRSATLKKYAVSGFLLVVLVLGTIIGAGQGNRNLDTGEKSLLNEATAHINTIDATTAPIIVPSPYTYYAASLYETSYHPVYYLWTNDLRLTGATRGLYDKPEARGIKDYARFSARYAHVWVLSELPPNISDYPASNWTVKHTKVFYDSATSKPRAYVTQYTAPR